MGQKIYTLSHSKKSSVQIHYHWLMRHSEICQKPHVRNVKQWFPFHSWQNTSSVVMSQMIIVIRTWKMWMSVNLNRDNVRIIISYIIMLFYCSSIVHIYKYIYITLYLWHAGIPCLHKYISKWYHRVACFVMCVKVSIIFLLLNLFSNQQCSLLCAMSTQIGLKTMGCRKALQLRKHRQLCLDHPEVLQLYKRLCALQAEQLYRERYCVSLLNYVFAIFTVRQTIYSPHHYFYSY